MLSSMAKKLELITLVLVVVAEVAGEAKVTMDGVAVIWEVVAGDLEAERLFAQSNDASAS